MPEHTQQADSSRKRYRTAAVLVLLAVALSIAIWIVSRPTTPYPDFVRYRDMDAYPPLAEGVRRAERVVLYEGLPHQLFEPDELRSELNSHHTVRIGGYPFYKQPLELAASDSQWLKEWFCRPQSFREMPQGWAKACGGFHPDFCIEWQSGTEAYDVLVCFNCREVFCIGPDAMLNCDIAEDFEQVERILAGYNKNRPPQ